MSTRTQVGVAAAVAVQLLYGCSFAFTKSVTGSVDPMTLLGWRFVTAFAAMLALMAARVIKVRVTKATLGPLLVLAAFQPLAYYVGETFGVTRTTASEGALIIAVIPVAMIVTAAIVVRRRPSRWQVAGVAVTLVGVAVTVVASGLAASFDPVGYTMLLAAVVAYALYAAFAERFAATATDVDKTFVMVACGALVFGGVAVGQHAADGTLPALAALPVTQPGFAVAVAYLALGSTIGAFFCQNVAISRLGSTRLSTYIGLSTVTTLAAGALALGETLSVAQLAGGAVILAGVYLANRRAARDARHA